MHNIISQNQLSEWGKLRKSAKNLQQTRQQMEKINDYFECLIECEHDSGVCKRICKQILL